MGHYTLISTMLFEMWMAKPKVAMRFRGPNSKIDLDRILRCQRIPVPTLPPIFDVRHLTFVVSFAGSKASRGGRAAATW